MKCQTTNAGRLCSNEATYEIRGGLVGTPHKTCEACARVWSSTDAPIELSPIEPAEVMDDEPETRSSRLLRKAFKALQQKTEEIERLQAIVDSMPKTAHDGQESNLLNRLVNGES